MKNIFKTASYTLIALVAVVAFCFSAFAAGNSDGNPLNTSQVISGVVLLIAAILVPAMKGAFKSAANK